MEDIKKQKICEKCIEGKWQQYSAGRHGGLKQFRYCGLQKDTDKMKRILVFEVDRFGNFILLVCSRLKKEKVMNAFCTECGFTTTHKEVSEDKFLIHLECNKCGAKRTWSKAGG